MLGRDEEIKKLEEFLRSEEENVAVVYGRKGMGKNALVSEVVASEKYLWFTGYPTTGDMEIRMMATVLQGRMEESLDIEKPEELFDAILAWADEEKATIVIDQYGAFAQAENDFNTALRDALVGKLGPAGIKVILILDSCLQAEKLLLGAKSPWKDVKRCDIMVDALHFSQARSFYPEQSIEEQFLLYGMTGGIPALLSMTAGMNPREALEAIFLNETGQSYLAGNAMAQDLREYSYYNRMLRALAKGYQRVNQISWEVGKPKDVVVPYMNTLMALGLVTKETPVTEKTNRRKTRYSIVNHADSFWYRFLLPRYDLTMEGDAEKIWDDIVEPHLNEYMQDVFSDICHEYLEMKSAAGELPCKLDEIGNWWENDDEKKTTNGFDLVGLGVMEGESATVFCRCYYGNEPIEISLLKELIELTKHTGQKGTSFYVIFSKAGFNDNALTVASAIRNIVLVGIDELSEM